MIPYCDGPDRRARTKQADAYLRFKHQPAMARSATLASEHRHRASSVPARDGQVNRPAMLATQMARRGNAGACPTLGCIGPVRDGARPGTRRKTAACNDQPRRARAERSRPAACRSGAGRGLAGRDRSNRAGNPISARPRRRAAMDSRGGRIGDRSPCARAPRRRRSVAELPGQAIVRQCDSRCRGRWRSATAHLWSQRAARYPMARPMPVRQTGGP